MNCGHCDKTDSLVYTSIPPKCKCTVSGRFHDFDDECDICHICGGNLINKGNIIICDQCDYYCLTIAPNSTDNSIHCMICNAKIYSGQICDKCEKIMINVRDKI